MEDKILEVIKKEKNNNEIIKEYVKCFIEDKKIKEKLKDNDLFKKISIKEEKQEEFDD